MVTDDGIFLSEGMGKEVRGWMSGVRYPVIDVEHCPVGRFPLVRRSPTNMGSVIGGCILLSSYVRHPSPVTRQPTPSPSPTSQTKKKSTGGFWPYLNHQTTPSILSIETHFYGHNPDILKYDAQKPTVLLSHLQCQI